MLHAGNFQGRVGSVIAPLSGLRGDVLRNRAQAIAVNGAFRAMRGRGLGSIGDTLCAGMSIGGSLATGYTSTTKTDPTIQAIIGGVNTLVGAACPAPSQPSPAATTTASNDAQIAQMQQQLAASNALMLQQQQQMALQAQAAARSGSSSGTIAGIKKETLMYAGGAVLLVGAAIWLLK